MARRRIDPGPDRQANAGAAPDAWHRPFQRAARALETRLLLPLMVVSALAMGFMKVASEVAEGDTHAFDLWLLQQLRSTPDQPVGPAWLVEVAHDLTSLGSPAVLVLVTAAAWTGLQAASCA